MYNSKRAFKQRLEEFWETENQEELEEKIAFFENLKFDERISDVDREVINEYIEDLKILKNKRMY